VPHLNYPALVTSLAQYEPPNGLPGVFFVEKSGMLLTSFQQDSA